LIVEALTAGLCGSGRADKPTGGGSPVFIQVIDPQAFAGLLRSNGRRAGWRKPAAPASRDRGLRRCACRATRPTRRQAQLAGGVELHPSIIPGLQAWADKFGITVPRALATAGG